MDTEAAEEKNGIRSETQESENTEHPEAAYDYKETDTDSNAEPIAEESLKGR